MALDRTDTIDAIAIEVGSDLAALTILDSWSWQDECDHLLVLQSKLSAYFRFVETGQIWESYAEAAGRQIVIDVVGKFPIPQIGIDFLHRAADACSSLNVKICYRQHP
jgi:Family of unknown function (DUF6572)